LRRIKDAPLLSNDSAARWPDTTPASPVHCFCCPPNVARTLAELSGWAYGVSPNTVWVHLYSGSVFDAAGMRLVQKTRYPWDGQVTITIEKTPDTPWALRLRIPGWAQGARLRINGKESVVEVRPLTYATVERRWASGDEIQLELPMEVVLVEAHPLVEETRNHVAVMRGPVVYCLESADLPGSTALPDVRLPRRASWQIRHDPDLLRGVTVLETEGTILPPSAPSSALYRGRPDGPAERIQLRLVPYYAWNNRGQGDMTVWIPLE
jgi:DUF1680 family protein